MLQQVKFGTIALLGLIGAAAAVMVVNYILCAVEACIS